VKHEWHNPHQNFTFKFKAAPTSAHYMHEVGKLFEKL